MGHAATVSVLAIALLAGTSDAQDCIWTLAASSGPAPRYDAGIAYDSVRGRVVLFGGQNVSTTFGDTWEWDGTAWTQVASAGPSPRYGHVMAFHQQWGRTVLFGASSSDFKTWTWDGAQWTALAFDNGYVPTHASIAYDALHQRMILFGDSSSDNATRELGADGAWTVLPISGFSAPPPRSSAAMTYDSDRARIIMFGGEVYPTSRNDVWEFDGTGIGSWIPKAPGPGGRYAAAMAYDPARHRAILHGGQSAYYGTYFSTAYEYDPAADTWTQRADDGPAWRVSASMVTDTARSSIFLFGGSSAGQAGSGFLHPETWRFDGSRPDGIFIIQSPVNVDVTLGQPASLAIQASYALGYQWYRNDIALADGGTISGSQTPTLSISATSIADRGPYTIVVRGPCSDVLRQVYITVEDPGCYLNCDGSTTAPILNVNDFQCYINKFAAGDSYANCDGSTVPPILNANDFNCYLNRFAAGC